MDSGHRDGTRSYCRRAGLRRLRTVPIALLKSHDVTNDTDVVRGTARGRLRCVDPLNAPSASESFSSAAFRSETVSSAGHFHLAPTSVPENCAANASAVATSLKPQRIKS